PAAARPGPGRADIGIGSAFAGRSAGADRGAPRPRGDDGGAGVPRHGGGGPAQRSGLRAPRRRGRGIRISARSLRRCRPSGRGRPRAARGGAGRAAPAGARLPGAGGPDPRGRRDRPRGAAGADAVSEFELLRNITIGQYLPTGSYLHRLDPRPKIIAALLLTAAVSFAPTLLGNACLLAACALVVWLGRIPFAYALRGLVPAIPFLVILAVLQLLFFGRNYDPASPVILQWGWIVVTAVVGRVVVVSAARFVELLMVTSVFTLSTRTTELTLGIESLLRPLRPLRVPAHELALVATIALRFIPTLALEAERLLRAQASRGGSLGGREGAARHGICGYGRRPRLGGRCGSRRGTGGPRRGEQRCRRCGREASRRAGS